MKKMRKISTVLLALIVALAMSAAAFGETGGVSEDAAVKKALKDANTSASKVKNLEVELDDNGKAYTACNYGQGRGHDPEGRR